ncbi:unnamed protein product [Rhizophagus irregularis]|nr:unnamed protein product [Rhizophagus irregularis]
MGDDNDSSNKDELEEYLCKPAAHKATYPHLAKMARDYLTILGTSVPVERIFSGGSDLITKRCSSLKPETIQMYMCLKNWIKYLQ